MSDKLRIGQTHIAPGQRVTLELPVARLYTFSDMTMPVHVIRGRRAGPRIFVCAALHGDEINGVEIIRRLLTLKLLRQLRGTLIAVPVVNVFGFINRSRYLPDRRDLNRSFPGSTKGSLTSNLARLFMKEIVANATHGIDLHTGSNHRVNLPQIRASMGDAETRRLAQAFGAPVIIDARLRDDSLRAAVMERNIPMLVYEGGEALRFNETAIRAGLRGVIAVMRALQMLPRQSAPRRSVTPLLARATTWVRAPKSGILRSGVALGAVVTREQPIARIGDPNGVTEETITSPADGIVIGRLELPLVHRGDALFNIASFQPDAPVDETVELLENHFNVDEGIAPIDDFEVEGLDVP